MLLNTLLKNIKVLVNGAVIKMGKTAKEYETLEATINADGYIAAVQKTDRFDLYESFDLEAIINANITPDIELQIQYANDPSTIPSQFKDAVLNAQRQFIIDNYIEINDYYRMLNGIPSINEDENEYIKLTEEQMLEHEITDDNYIHLLSDSDIFKIKESGLLDVIKSNNPTKKYLNYLGTDKIDIVQARISNNFDIMKISNQNVPDDFYNTFIQIYNQNREYFMSVLYIPNYSDSYDLYDNFIGLCIMLMTVQRLVSNTFKFGIQRDFYDWAFIRNIYKMYNIPFIESLPIEYQVSLVKNINNLLRYKSTDKVLFDIASLLGYERINIFKYYLIKRQRLNENEEPIFYYRQMKDENGDYIFDEDGKPIYEEDVERMYELYFQRVNLKERNLALALQNESNKLSYEEVTINDPYWWEDSNLTDIMYNDTYNYVETKYLSLNMMYKLTEMLFEITYAFRLIIDRKDDISEFTISIPKIYPNSDFKVFDIIIFMVALLCKNHGFKDGIITTPSMISHIYGFNFNEEIINNIKNTILNNSELIDPELLDYFTNLEITEADDVNKLFVKIRDYNNIIISKMRNATNIKEYHLYKDIFNISMVSETQTDMFKIQIYEDGELVERPAKTYLEYLEHTEPILAEIVKSTEVDNIPSMLDHLTSQINMFMKDMQYLFIINDNNNPAFIALTSLIKFFKSYTVDLASFNILYVLDSKYYNMIKFIEDIHMINVHINSNEYFNHNYSDSLHTMKSEIIANDDKINFDEYIDIKATMHFSDENYKLIDYINELKTYLTIEDGDHNLYNDGILSIISKMKTPDNNIYTDVKLLYNIVLNHKDKNLFRLLNDSLNIVSERYAYSEKENIYDKIKLIDKDVWIKILNVFKDKYITYVNSICFDKYFINDSSNIDKLTIYKDFQNVLSQSADIYYTFTNSKYKDKLSMKDKLIITYED